MSSKTLMRRLRPLTSTSSRFAPRAPLSSTPFPQYRTCQRARSTMIASGNHQPIQRRTYANPAKSIADEKIEEITEMYATAKDEFEIASEETDKKSVYAADDRAAAREEFNNLKAAYENALRGPSGEEIGRRVGQRVRELERGIEGMEERAMED